MTVRDHAAIARDLPAIRAEHARLAADLSALGEEDRRTLARLDDDLTRFDALCTATFPLRLYASGALLPGDEMRHPAAPAATARAAVGNAVEIDGETVDLHRATAVLARRPDARGPVAAGDWEARGTRIGDALGLGPRCEAVRPLAADAKPAKRAAKAEDANMSFGF